MSRIDEALKRAAGIIPERRESGAGPVREHIEAFTLERYPREAVTQRDDTLPGLGDRPPDAVVAGGPRLVALPGGTGARPTRAADAAGAEQYRRIATTLEEAQVRQGLKTVMVTSALAGEGRTQAAVQLALSLSRSQARVLLVDADLSGPGVHDALGIRNEPGVTEWLQSQLLELPLVEMSPQLHVLLAGEVSGNPLPALISEEMRVLLTECAARFDWVVLDTPPVDVLPEPQWLTNLVQAVVLVVGGGTPFPVVQDAIGRLGRTRIVATVLNGIQGPGPESK